MTAAGNPQGRPGRSARAWQRSWTERDGVRLAAYTAGRGDPLLLLHGFTGSHETWTPYIPSFSVGRRAIAVDLVGHGRSDAPDDLARYSIDACIADLSCLLDDLQVGRTDLLGYSMGGRLALHFTVAHPDRVRRLILVSATAGLTGVEARRTRREADEALARRIERAGIEAFCREWESLSLFATQADLPDGRREALRRQRLANRPAGLAGSLRGMGQGVMPPVWDRLGAIESPVLVIAGALDSKYCTIGRRLAAAIPDSRLTVVPAAGHAAHFERPERFRHVVCSFLEEAGQRTDRSNWDTERQKIGGSFA